MRPNLESVVSFRLLEISHFVEAFEDVESVQVGVQLGVRVTVQRLHVV